MKLLHITREYFPFKGGIGVFSFNFDRKMENKCDLKTIYLKNKSFSIKRRWNRIKSIFKLYKFVIYAFLKALMLNKKERFDFIMLDEAMLTPMGSILKIFTNTKVVARVHGLDVISGSRLWQKILVSSFKRMDKIICVSDATRKQVIKRGVPKDKVIVVSNAINKDEFLIKKSISKIKQRLPKKVRSFIKGKKVLLSVGRFVRRKGFNWFVSNVMPRISDEYFYLIVGDGLELNRVKETIKAKQLQKNVMLLGAVDNSLLRLLYNVSDVFVMPNIKVKNDMEGFGIVIIEAGSCGLPVVASNIEGIKDAVINNKTGFLVKHENVNAFIKGIKTVNKLNKLSIRKEVLKRFEWELIADKFIQIFRSIKN